MKVPQNVSGWLCNYRLFWEEEIMFKLSRLSMLTAAIILALLFSAFPLGAVMAEGEEPALPETPVTEEVPAVQEEAPPAKEEAPLTVEEVADQAPEGVAVVPVDSVGAALPIVEEATATTLVSGDPAYCPGYAVWGDPVCSEPLPTIEAALAMAAEQGSGTIYVATDYVDKNPAPVVIDGLALWGAPGWMNLIGGFDFDLGDITGSTAMYRQVFVSNLTEFTIKHFDFEDSLPAPLALEAPPSEEPGYIANSDVNVFSSNLSNNAGAGLTIDINGSVAIEDVKIYNNDEPSSIAAGPVTLFNVEATGNRGGPGLKISSADFVMVERSKFNENEGHGLWVDQARDIFISCSQALNNGLLSPQLFAVAVQGPDGMNLSSENDILLLCNKMKGNAGYGVNATSTEGTIYLVSNSVTGNGPLGDENLVGLFDKSQTLTCSYLCPSCSGGGSAGEEEKPAEGNTQVVIVKVGEGDGTAEIKPGYSTVFKLYEQQKEENKRLVQLTALASGSAPSGSSAVYTPLDEGTLPAPLPEGASLIPWGFNLTLTNPDGTPVESLIGYMLVRFYLPEGFVLPGGMHLVIQHFDPAASSWEPMSTAVGGGTAYTYVSKPGTYVLTMVPIE
jgi:hypothetical protein